MRLHSKASGRPGRLVPAMTMAAVLALTLAACSSPASPATHVTGKKRSLAVPSAAAPAASSAAPAAAAPAAAAAASGLSGKWSGQYSGAFAGTFNLNWRQSGSKLNGFIQLSSPGTSQPINGSVAGSTIRFGTVGSSAITYTGTVSGNSMSGTYRVHDGAGSRGNWSASKP
jgi:hypothetical protein